MKFISKITLIAFIGFVSSCAMIGNEKLDDVTINSSPPGADIFIDGVNKGRTPATITIEPKSYTVVLTKEGYGSTELKLEAWASAKNGNCMADMIGAMLIVPLYSAMYSGYCDEFKKDSYSAVIPNTSAASSGRRNEGRGRNNYNPRGSRQQQNYYGYQKNYY